MLSRDPNIVKYMGTIDALFEPVSKHIIAERPHLGPDIQLYQFVIEFRGLIANDESWLLQLLKGSLHPLLGPYSPIVINALFIKIYDANIACIHWPPLGYPLSEPLLVTVPGYHGETIKECYMRILKMVGRDLRTGYNPSVLPSLYEPDLSNYPAVHIYEKAWSSDADIIRAYEAIKSSDMSVDLILPNILNVSVTTHEILLTYSNVNAVYGDVICSNMVNNTGRFIGPIMNSINFMTFFNSISTSSTEFSEIHFNTRGLSQEKLTTQPWPQQIFVLIGPNEDPEEHSVVTPKRVLRNGMPEIELVPVFIRDTYWIKCKTNPEKYSTDSLCIIQGAFMPSYVPFLEVFLAGIESISPRISQRLQQEENDIEASQRRQLILKLNERYGLMRGKNINEIMNDAPFTFFGKQIIKRDYIKAAEPVQDLLDDRRRNQTNYEPLKRNLRKLRRTFKKPSWHFWSSGPDTMVRDIITRYGAEGLLQRDENILNAAIALQNHHTTANKDSLIEALEDAIRRRRGTEPVAWGGTDYVGIQDSLNELLEELSRPFYRRGWGKTQRLIGILIDKHLDEFIYKGDDVLVTALQNLRSSQNPNPVLVHRVVDALRRRAMRRHLTERGQAVPYITSEGGQGLSILRPKEVEQARRQAAVTRLALSKPAFTTDPYQFTEGNLEVKIPSQGGGWSPSLMSSFAINGMRLLPVAGYMGYKMYKNSRKAKKVSRRTRKNR